MYGPFNVFFVCASSWGWNSKGQLGYGDSNNRGDEANEMGDYLPEVQLPTGFTIDEIFVAGTNTLVRSTTGVIVCFGGYMGCGGGHTENVGDSAGQMGDSLVPIDLGSDFYPVKLGGGSGRSCAITSDGKAKWYVV